MGAVLFCVGSRSRRASFIILACVLVAASASGAPELSITAPPFGQPLTDLRPTVVVSYSSPDPAVPVDVPSFALTVTENGRPVQGTTTPGESSATFVPTHDITAGSLEVAASISDIAGASVSTSQSYDVLPIYQALTPTTALADETLTVTAPGLDPEGDNSLVFYSLRPPGTVEAPLDSIDREAGTATVRVPEMAASGKTFAKVNGRLSQTSLTFTLRPPYTICGSVYGVIAMADGSLIVSHSGSSSPRPGCPYVSSSWNTIVSRSYPSGDVRVIDQFKTASGAVPYSSETGVIRDLAVDRTGEKWALMLTGAYGPGFSVKYQGRTMWLPTAEQDWRYQALDFDRSGNLVLVIAHVTGSYGGTLRFLRIPAQSLETAQTGDTLPIEDIATHSLGPYDDLIHFEPRTFRVSCADRFFFGVWQWGDIYTDTDHRAWIYEGDLATGAISKRFETPGVVDTLALSCHSGEVYGVRQVWYEPSVFWRWAGDDTGQVEDIDKVEHEGIFFRLVVLPSGTLLSFVQFSQQMPLVESVEPCTDCADGSCCAGSAQPFCPRPPAAGITILTSTTRWRPQKDTTKPIDIIFTGPSDLADASKWPNVTAEIRDPNGAAVPAPNLAFSVSNASANEYRLTWSGPWLTDQANPASYLPGGNYEVLVKATHTDGTVVASTPYQNVSLVEVTSVMLDRLPANPSLEANPGLAGGRRIFSEADNPSPDDDIGDRDKVSVIARIDPAVSADASHPVKVYFRGLDVDDPSAGLDPTTGLSSPIDDETLPTDNCPGGGCLAPAAGKLIVPVDGRLEERDASLPVGVPVPNGETLVSAVFQVSRRQGDNYRIAASTSDSWLDPAKLAAVQNSTTAAVVHSTGEEVREGTQLTEMLTVWRTLHLELDHLDSSIMTQDSFDVAGVSTMLEATRLKDDTGPFRLNGNKPCDHCENNDWRGADLWPRDPFTGGAATPDRPGGVFKVTGSGRKDLKAGTSDDLLSAPALAGDPYRVRDDYWVDLSRDLPLGLTTTLLTRAYIRVKTETDLNQLQRIPFEDNRNLSWKGLAQLGDPRWPVSPERQRSVGSSAAYWSVMGVVAFDANVLDSCDPCGKRANNTTHNGTFGWTFGGGQWIPGDDRQPVFAVFLETLRDRRLGQGRRLPPCSNSFENMLATTTAHEILAHALGLGSTENTLTYELNGVLLRRSCAGDPLANRLMDGQIRWLRELRQPIVDPGNDRPLTR